MAQLPPDGALCGLRGLAGRLHPVRLQAPRLGGRVGLEMERARRTARPDAGSRAGRFGARDADWRRRRGDWAARGPARDRRRGGQGLRDTRRRRDHARCRRNLLRDDGDDQRDDVPVSGGDPLHSALSGRAAGTVHRRGPDLSRFLDGELVQATVRPPGNRGRAQRRRGAGSAFRSARSCRRRRAATV